MKRALLELFKYRSLIRYMVTMDLRVRYRGSFFGFLWTLLNPLLLMAVMWVVFSRFGRIKEDNYALFLLSGLIAWQFFSQSVNRSLTSITGNRGLIQKVYLPKIVFPISIVTSNLVNLLFFLIAYLVIAIAAYQIPLTALLFAPVVAMLFIMAAGAGMIIATLNVFFRDFTHLTSVILRALFYLTPIFYPPEILGPKVHMLLGLNPLYYPLVIGREVLYYGRVPSPELWAVGCAAAVTLFTVGLAVFTNSQDKFVYYA